MGKQTHLLNHITDVAPQLDDVTGGNIDSVKEDLPRRWLDLAVDHLEACGVAAARGADEDADLPRRDSQRKIVDCSRRTTLGFGGAVVLGDMVKHDRCCVVDAFSHPLDCKETRSFPVGLDERSVS